ncbi:MAG: flagellar hook-basal body complex protein FliE, partial [Sinobacteraceae bacterium]|nr:flagellar hook-basal body complex protein FliE [Nevskiaceae bacterium]
AAPQKSGPSEFATLLSKGIDQVNQTSQRAAQLSTAFQRGDPGVELPQVMVEMEKASVSFRALTEVRNRLVSAYQEIMNMQI